MIRRYQSVHHKDGKCPEGFNMNEDGQCYPDEPCPAGYWRADDDESGACVPRTEAAASLMNQDFLLVMGVSKIV